MNQLLRSCPQTKTRKSDVGEDVEELAVSSNSLVGIVTSSATLARSSSTSKRRWTERAVFSGGGNTGGELEDASIFLERKI